MSKVNSVCKLMREAMQDCHETSFLSAIVLTFVRQNPPKTLSTSILPDPCLPFHPYTTSSSPLPCGPLPFHAPLPPPSLPLIVYSRLPRLSSIFKTRELRFDPKD
eukprot:712784-Hanusia_phi.AAC.2